MSLHRKPEKVGAASCVLCRLKITYRMPLGGEPRILLEFAGRQWQQLISNSTLGIFLSRVFYKTKVLLWIYLQAFLSDNQEGWCKVSCLWTVRELSLEMLYLKIKLITLCIIDIFWAPSFSDYAIEKLILLRYNPPHIFLYKARCHGAWSANNVLRNWHWEVLEHPPYYPDMCPCCIHLYI